MLDYPAAFARLELNVSDCGLEQRAFVAQLSRAPIWDDERAAGVLARWETRIEDALWRGVSPYGDEVHGLMVGCLAELRGETTA